MSMTIQEAIRCLHLPGDHLKDYEEYGLGIDDELRDAISLAMTALREKAEREDPKPLTLEEVKNADGPLWIAQLVTRGIECDPDWAILTDSGVPGAFYVWWFGSECEETARHVDYGKTWIAYRHKPKEVLHAE